MIQQLSASVVPAGRADELERSGVRIALSHRTKMLMPLDILIVDEDPAALAALVAALTQAGHAVTGVPTFREGIRTLTSTSPALLVCSVRLGPFNGLHLLMRGRAEHPGLPAILMGPPSDVVACEARALGAAVYLAQPIDLDALMAAVADLRDGSSDAGSGFDSGSGVDVGDLPVFLER
jgi:DNA-binding NtrC family response regulator